MSGPTYNSRVFVAWRALHGLLQAAQYPGAQPAVQFGVHINDSSRETIGVVPRIEDPEIEWARVSPAGRDERFPLDVIIRTSIPGVSSEQVVDRLEQLANAVQEQIHDVDTAKFKPLDFLGTVALGGVVSVAPELRRDGEGWIGACTVTVAIVARI